MLKCKLAMFGKELVYRTLAACECTIVVKLNVATPSNHRVPALKTETCRLVEIAIDVQQCDPIDGYVGEGLMEPALMEMHSTSFYFELPHDLPDAPRTADNLPAPPPRSNTILLYGLWQPSPSIEQMYRT